MAVWIHMVVLFSIFISSLRIRTTTSNAITQYFGSSSSEEYVVSQFLPSWAVTSDSGWAVPPLPAWVIPPFPILAIRAVPSWVMPFDASLELPSEPSWLDYIYTTEKTTLLDKKTLLCLLSIYGLVTISLYYYENLRRAQKELASAVAALAIERAKTKMLKQNINEELRDIATGITIGVERSEMVKQVRQTSKRIKQIN